MKSVFISSTFKDMQTERDYLHERIFPQIRRKLQESGETIQELDLRWGVDTSDMTEEESGKQVLKVCIDAIDRCKPYTIVLLGERYGWIPGISVVKEANDDRIGERYQENMSITNLEIRYAALDDEELMKRCIFCFRDPAFLKDMNEGDRRIYDAESPMHRERLDRLKEEIRGLTDVKIIEYGVSWDQEMRRPTGMEQFGEQVLEQLTAMMQKESGGKKPGTLEERMAAETAYRRENSLSSYIQRGKEEYAVLRQAQEYQMNQDDYSKKRCNDTCLCGEAGSGKSALMAACAKRLEDNGEQVILYFCGASGCQDQNALKRMMVWHLERILGIEGTSGTLDERLGDLNGRLGKRQVYCFLDGIDQMFPEGSELYLDVLSKCTQVYFILSAVPDFPVEELFEKAGRSVSRVSLGGLETFQVRQFIDATTSRRGKKLDERLVGEILRKKGAANPLYLSLILQRFFMMEGREFQRAEELAPGMEGLHRYMTDLLSGLPESTEALVKTVLLTTGRRFGEGEFELILGLLAASKGGLAEEELEKIFGLAGRPFSPLRFQQIVSYLYDAFQLQTNGKWDFTHRLFGEAMLKQPGIKEARQLLIRFALRDDAFLEQEGFTYILDARLPEGASVLERSKNFAEPKRVCEYVAEMIKRGETAYFEEMLKGTASDALTDFWVRVFPENDYGIACQEFQTRMWQKLLQSVGVSAGQTAEICVRLAESALKVSDYSKAEEYLQQGKDAADGMSEPEKSLMLARLIFQKANSINMQRLAGDIELYEQAGNLAAAASEKLWAETAGRSLTLPEGETPTFGKLFDEAVYWRLRARCARFLEVCRRKKELLIPELDKEVQFLELHQNHVSEEICAEGLLRLVCCRMELLLSQGLTKEEKRKEAERFLKASSGIAEDYPSAQNLSFTYWILEFYRQITDTSEQYRVCRTQILYARRLAQRRGSFHDRYDLMYALLLYAYRADCVLMGSPSMKVEKEIGTDTEACWEEGFALLEQLRSEKKDASYLLWDAAYFYIRFCDCRISLDFDEAKYPVILERAGKVLQACEEAKAAGEQTDSTGWLQCVRDAHHDMGVLYAKLHENAEAVRHLKEAEKTGWQICEEKPSAKNLLKYLLILTWYMDASYQARQDDAALAAAAKSERLLKDWQATGCEEHIIRLLYVRGRIAFERGDLSTAEQVLRQLAPYREMLKKKTLGDRCLLLTLDVACAKADLPAAKEAWAAAEEHLLQTWKNGHMRKHLPSMAAGIRYYLEYGYGKIVKLLAEAGEPIPPAEQKTWFEALDAPLKDRAAERAEENRRDQEEKYFLKKSAEDQKKELEKKKWREYWQKIWSEMSAAAEQADTEQLLTLLELYEKLAAEDSEHDILAYQLRKERQKLTKELYWKTKDPRYVEDYLQEIDRLAAGYVDKDRKESLVGSAIPIFEWAEDWEHCAIDLLKDLYEETGDHSFLTSMMSYLEHAVKRYNLSRIGWYLETFAYLENYMTEETEKERFQALRQARYGWELERMMMTYRISRVKDKEQRQNME